MLVNQLILGHSPFFQGAVKRLVRDHIITSAPPYHAQIIDYYQYIEYNEDNLYASNKRRCGT